MYINKLYEIYDPKLHALVQTSNKFENINKHINLSLNLFQYDLRVNFIN